MIRAELPENEAARLRALESYDILDTLSEAAYDDITFLASHICGTPIALVSLIDRDRQWFKSRVGLEATETPRDQAFCAHAILNPGELLVVPDARQDSRFAGNPLVTGDPDIRFYAGAPLVTGNQEALGTLCVIDREPRDISEAQREALLALSRQVMAQLELRRSLALKERHEAQLERYQRRLEKINARLELESTTDILTGLWNRRAFLERLELEVERTKRYEATFSLAWIDVDHFKAFNDEFGHPAGDEVLRKIARLLERGSRRTDYVARCGGEEFAVILPGTSDEGAAAQAERIRRRIESAAWKRRPMTVSIGVATWRPETASGSALMGEADKALYRAKKRGRNRVVVSGPGDPGETQVMET